MNFKMVIKVECHRTIFEQNRGLREPGIYFYASKDCEKTKSLFSIIGSHDGFISYYEIVRILCDFKTMGATIEFCLEKNLEKEKSFIYGQQDYTESHLDNLFIGDDFYKYPGIWVEEVTSVEPIHYIHWIFNKRISLSCMA